MRGELAGLAGGVSHGAPGSDGEPGVARDQLFLQLADGRKILLCEASSPEENGPLIEAFRSYLGPGR